ncbi:MAG: hypothetical protein V4632_08290 [Pseudomonadota bacterium]
MNKKGRIAIAVTGIYAFFPLIILTGGKSEAVTVFLFASIPIALYWGYRFIKNDISFLKNDSSNKP